MRQTTSSDYAAFLRKAGKALGLTWQQAHILREFMPADCPHGASSETLAISGVREWPTCNNLIALGLIERDEWSGENEGWIYSCTAKGSDVLRKLEALR